MWNSASPEQFRTNNFSLLRLGLAGLVLFAHSFVAVNGSNRGEPLYELTGGRLDLGALAVNGFFIASGVMVSESLFRGRGTWDFLRKRTRRLYPAFFALWLLQALIIAPLASKGDFQGYSLRQVGILLFNLATLSSYGYPFGGLLQVFPDNPVPGEMNVSLWTLRYEFGCYLGLAALGWLGWFRQRWLVTVLFLIAWAVHISGWRLPWHRILTALVADGTYWPRFATYFLAGATFWHWRGRIPRRTAFGVIALGLTIIAFGLPGLIPALLPPAWCYALMWLAYCPGNALQRMYDATDVSYGTYLYAFPIQQVVVMVHPEASVAEVFLVTLPLTLLAGFASWHLVEKRWLRVARAEMAASRNGLSGN